MLKVSKEVKDIVRRAQQAKRLYLSPCYPGEPRPYFLTIEAPLDYGTLLSEIGGDIVGNRRSSTIPQWRIQGNEALEFARAIRSLLIPFKKMVLDDWEQYNENLHPLHSATR